jgi:hypothetical protein
VEMPPTQIGRGLQELGIAWIPAHSPQADGSETDENGHFRHLSARLQPVPGKEGGRCVPYSARIDHPPGTRKLRRTRRFKGVRIFSPWAELGGDISTGEFGSLLRSLLRNPDSDFHFIREDQVGGAAAAEYAFRISRAQSDWKILSDDQFVVPEYSGRIWFDRSSNRILRIERAAEEIPSAFPLRSVEVDVTFDEIKLGSSDTYLLPLQADARVCVRDRQECSRKTIDFRDYQKFRAESKILSGQ